MKKDWIENGVSMIPSSLVACLVNGIEARIVTMSEQGFTIRVSKKLLKIHTLTLCYYQFKASIYEEILLTQYQMIHEEQEEFFLLYTFLVQQKDYESLTKAAIKDYGEYISLKLSNDDAYCSERKVGYPSNADEEFYETFEEQQKDWFQESNWNSSWMEKTTSIELAMELDSPKLYERFLAIPVEELVKEQLENKQLLHHPLFLNKVRRVYIGNQFCHLLFPNTKQLIEMLNKARNEGLQITIAFTYVRDCYIEETMECITAIVEWARENKQIVEVIVNDWGMIPLLYGTQDYITRSLGVLLNKRRKDPRYSYKSGYLENIVQLSKNNLDNKEYRDYLKAEMNIERYEYESCGYPLNLPTKHHSLHLPYYQTNTSQFCTLYAMCTTGNRGNQRFVDQCPRFCEDYVFLYPKHLNMVGRYNSLFGFDDVVLRDKTSFESLIEQGIDRIVLSLW